MNEANFDRATLCAFQIKGPWCDLRPGKEWEKEALADPVEFYLRANCRKKISKAERAQIRVVSD